MNQQWVVVVFALSCFIGGAQYTDQINSNRPGMSIGAFAVGKRVVQFEAGAAKRFYTHSGFNKSTIDGTLGFMSVRWGFLKEELELTYEGTFMWDKLYNKTTGGALLTERKGFLQNFLGIKYLIFDPFKKEEEPNLYSWKANNRFRLREILPAVSLTFGANVLPKALNPYPYGNVFAHLYQPFFYQNINQPLFEENMLSLRGTLATQSHFFERWVFVTNVSYNRLLTPYPEMSYILTLTHTFHPLWSVYLETQGIDSYTYSDSIFRLGAAYLLYDNVQLEATLGTNTKNSPNMIFVNAGVSYRLDFHKAFTSAAEREAKAEKKEGKKLKKSLKKRDRQNTKRTRKARKN